MTFESPGALWALTSLALLVIFSLWRQAAARTIVPSVGLWKKIPERNPPIRALRRPKWRVELLLQALAIAATVTALAGPFATTSKAKSRKVALVFDTSARMQAGGRIEKARTEARRLADGPLAGDELSIYAAVPAPARLKGIDEVRGIDAHVDLEPLLAAARQGAEHVIVFGDRPVAGTHGMLFGNPEGNSGITELTVTDDEVFVRLVHHGAPRKATIRLEWGSQKVEKPIDLPLDRWFHKGDFSKAGEVRVALEVADGFPLDDSVRATRLGSGRITVAVGGTGIPLLERALGSIPGVAIRRDGGEARLGVGVDAPPPKAPFSVWLHSPEGRFKPQAWDPPGHPLTEGLRTSELGQGGVGELPPEARAGVPLLVADGKRVAVLNGTVLHLSIDLAPQGWSSTPSFPIFWKNVVDFGLKGASAFAVVRTGRPFDLPPEASEGVWAPPGALFSLSPSGRFLAYTRGEYVFRAAGVERSVEANLLDERESDTAGVTRPLDWDPSAPAGREFVRRGLAGWMAALALVLVMLAWVLQRRSD
jgi:hypothetical protein